MRTPVIFHRPDFCPHCKSHAIELFDYFNNRMFYSKIIDMHDERHPINTLINKRAIYRMKCRSCGHIYPIRWEGNFPVPDVYESHKDHAEFMQEYKRLAE